MLSLSRTIREATIVIIGRKVIPPMQSKLRFVVNRLPLEVCFMCQILSTNTCHCIGFRDALANVGFLCSGEFAINRRPLSNQSVKLPENCVNLRDDFIVPS